MPDAAPDEPQVARFREELHRFPTSRPAALLAAQEHMFGLAVSGGPDSVALLLLAHAAFPGRIAAATVDHGLRAGSAGDGRFVAAICGERSIPHATLPVTVERTGEGLQAAAREARYTALGGWCRDAGCAALLTAHHADDRAETLLMRLARGAGIGGLAGIREARDLGAGVPLLRPLLGWRRAELAAIVDGAGITPLADPANRDPRHDRTAVRALLAETPALDPARLAASAAHLAQAEAALAWAAEREWRARSGCEGTAIRLDPAGLPPELVRRLVLRAIAEAGGGVPRGTALAGFIATLTAGGVATLAGVRGAGGGYWRFTAARPHRR